MVDFAKLRQQRRERVPEGRDADGNSKLRWTPSPRPTQRQVEAEMADADYVEALMTHADRFIGLQPPEYWG